MYAFFKVVARLLYVTCTHQTLLSGCQGDAGQTPADPIRRRILVVALERIVLPSRTGLFTLQKAPNVITPTAGPPSSTHFGFASPSHQAVALLKRRRKQTTLDR